MNNITLMHEHTIIDLSYLKKNDDCNFNNKEQIIKEFKTLYQNGVRNIVDVTVMGMKRNPLYVKEVADATKINIILSTGWYQEIFLPEYVANYSIEKLADIMIKEIEVGIDETQIKAKIIGEIASSHNLITDNELKIFKAAIIAHRKTNVLITTHTTLGTMGMEQVAIFKEGKVDLNRVIIGHTDLSGDVAYALKLVKEGVNIGFDTIGKTNYLKDEIRVEMLKKLQDEGFIDKIVLSLDITRKSNLKDQNGIGYMYLLDTFIPMLLAGGVTQDSIEKMMISNPKRLLGDLI